MTTQQEGQAQLEARQVVRRYGGITAVDQVNLVAVPGRVTGLIGPNGAGKTTLFHCLSGHELPDDGHVLLGGRDVTRLHSDQRARLGIARTFQRMSVFPSLTVAENLRVGAENHTKGEILRGLVGLPSRDARATSGVVEDTLAILGLTPIRDERAGALPTGTLRLVELGRALCSRPLVLMLDEPASGLDDAETHELAGVLRHLAATGMAVLLVEHDLALVFTTADIVYALAGGRIIASGTPEQIQSDPEVRSSYLEAPR